MKINVHGGHNYYVTGANCLLNELNEDRKVKDKVVDLLKKEGHTVYDCTDDKGKSVNGNLNNIVVNCNSHEVDLDVSIHLNSGRNDAKGDGNTGGIEVWIYSDKSKAKSYAEKVCASVSKELNLHNRGVKVSNSLYVLRFTNAPAMLIECCFVDDKDDADHWDAGKCAKAIVKAILNKEVSEHTDKPEHSNPETVSSKKPMTSRIDVDGYWGIKTTKKAQKVFKTTIDGIVSNQYAMYKAKNPGCQSDTWQWLNKPGKAGSQLIKAIQRKVGAKVNGFAGPETFGKMQKWLGTEQDGHVSSPSQMVKAFQHWLNKQ